MLCILKAMWPMVRQIGDINRDLDAVEFHCGAGAITKANNAKNVRAVGMDLLLGDVMTTQEGLLARMTTLMRVRSNGLMWSAQECRTLVWSCRASTGRDKPFPAGDGRTEKSSSLINKLLRSQHACS